MRYFGVRTTAVATQGSGMAAAATELSRTASASVFIHRVIAIGQNDRFFVLGEA